MNYKNYSTYKFLKLPFKPERVINSIAEKPPKRILFWKINTDLIRMTFRQRAKLIDEIKKGNIFNIYRELTSIPHFILMHTKIKKTYPFIKLVVDDLAKRNKRDEMLAISYTRKEVSAGIRKLNFGDFGIIDALVRRYNGAYTHEQIENWKDIAVFTALRIEVETSKYQRNLNKLK